ncbi:hypothetical protein MLD52_23165, partial [Puniceicoccaceae bacterium K14]|nr:hypothetical protein [Puniceicoccaceae bacterium K14]
MHHVAVRIVMRGTRKPIVVRIGAVNALVASDAKKQRRVATERTQHIRIVTAIELAQRVHHRNSQRLARVMVHVIANQLVVAPVKAQSRQAMLQRRFERGSVRTASRA